MEDEIKNTKGLKNLFYYLKKNSFPIPDNVRSLSFEELQIFALNYLNTSIEDKINQQSDEFDLLNLMEVENISTPCNIDDFSLEDLKTYALNHIPISGYKYYTNICKHLSSIYFDNYQEALENMDKFILRPMLQHSDIYNEIIKEIGFPSLSVIQSHLTTLIDRPHKFIIIGNGSAGKSTFINMLLGFPLLPSMSGETTTVFTEIINGDNPDLWVTNTLDGTGINIPEFRTVVDKCSFLCDYLCTPKYSRAIITWPISENPMLHKYLSENKGSTISSILENISLIDCPGLTGETSVENTERLDKIIEESRDCAGYIWILNQDNMTDGLKDIVKRLSTALDKKISAPIFKLQTRTTFNTIISKESLFIINKYDDITSNCLSKEETLNKAKKNVREFVVTNWGKADCLFLSSLNALNYFTKDILPKEDEIELLNEFFFSKLSSIINRSMEQSLEPLITIFKEIITQSYILSNHRNKILSKETRKELRKELNTCKNSFREYKSLFNKKAKEIIETEQENMITFIKVEESQSIINTLIDEVTRAVVKKNKTQGTLNDTIVTECRAAVSSYYRWLAVSNPDIGLNNIIRQLNDLYSEIYYIPHNICLEAKSTLSYRIPEESDKYLITKIIAAIGGVVLVGGLALTVGFVFINPIGMGVITGATLVAVISAAGAFGILSAGTAINAKILENKDWKNLTVEERSILVREKSEITIKKALLSKDGSCIAKDKILKPLLQKVKDWDNRVSELEKRIDWKPTEIDINGDFYMNRDKSLYNLNVLQMLNLFDTEGGISEEHLKISESFINKGASGSIFEGILLLENGDKRDVAVKLFSSNNGNKFMPIKDWDDNKEAFNSFIDERDIYRKFKDHHNPNIIKYYGWFVWKKEADDNTLKTYGISEICFGIVLEKGKPFCKHYISSLANISTKFNTFVDVLIQILNGLIYMHQKSCIHRDIKIGNIIIGNDNNIKLIDFGISKNLGLYTQTFLAGTMAYMAPEVRDKKTIYGQQVDVYSFGMTAVTIWNGETPTVSQNSFDNIRFSPQLPNTDIQEILLKTLVEKPTKRPFLKDIFQVLKNFINQ